MHAGKTRAPSAGRFSQKVKGFALPYQIGGRKRLVENKPTLMNTWICLLGCLLSGPFSLAQAADFPWLEAHDPAQAIEHRIAPPPGYQRDSLPAGSFGHWLRQLPLKPGQPPVYLHDGRPKGNQQAQAAVLDLDTGPRDLQQCADAVMRLRAEYLQIGRAHV
jgi:hypothetical protein